jgi:protein ImuA
MTPSPSDLLAALREEVERREGSHLAEGMPPISTGVPALDQLLPWGGLRPGCLVEYFGHGAGAVALAAARSACRQGRALLVVDRHRQFYPPAAAGWGIDLSQTVILRPASAADELWAVDQALRSPGVGAVWVWCGSLTGHDFRRLQLAAESGGTLGLLLRAAQRRGQPTWADVQWLVEPQPSPHGWRLRVTLVRCRGGNGGRSVLLELNEETATWLEADDSHATQLVHPPAELADPAAARRRSRD